jgi:ectoine hydroxylase-related dioxygenase (phytanoyl-CoA dioxygenase family)
MLGCEERDRMHAYADSTPLAGDRDALRRRLRADGYLFFRRLLPADRVLAVREALLTALDESEWLAPGSPVEAAKPGPVLRLEGAPEFWDGYANIQRKLAFHRLAHAPELLAVLRRLIADDLLVHPRKISRVSFPNSGFTTPPHQDYRYIQGTTDVFTAWLPLAACPPELGGLRVLGGSQTRGLLPTSNAKGAGGLAVDVPDHDVDWATIDYEPGDVLVFHSLTVHGALPNVSDRLRLSVDYRYQAASDPVAAPTLRPHFHPDVPDWNELTRDWDDLDAIAAPDSLEVRGFDPPAGPLVPGPSRFVPLPA